MTKYDLEHLVTSAEYHSDLPDAWDIAKAVHQHENITDIKKINGTSTIRLFRSDGMVMEFDLVYTDKKGDIQGWTWSELFENEESDDERVSFGGDHIDEYSAINTVIIADIIAWAENI